MISLPGAALMNAAFLQDKAAVISFCRGSKRKEGVEYKYWFNNLNYGTFQMFCKDEMTTVGSDTYVKITQLRQRLVRLGM